MAVPQSCCPLSCSVRSKKPIPENWRVWQGWGCGCHVRRSEVEPVILPEGQTLGRLNVALDPMS